MRPEASNASTPASRRRALLEQRALGRVLDPARRVIADLLDRVGQSARPECKVVGRHHVIGHRRRRVGAEAVGDDLPQ